GEVAGGTQEHRGVAVMAAGVHLAGRLGGVRQVGQLLDRQCVHVGAQTDRLDALARRLPALDHPDHARLTETGDHLCAPELAQAVSNECCGAVNVVEQLRVLVNVPPPGLDVRLEVGYAVHDGHGKSQAFSWECRTVYHAKWRST